MVQKPKRRRLPTAPKVNGTAKLIEFWNHQAKIFLPQNPSLATVMITNYLSQRFWFGGQTVLDVGVGHGRFLPVFLGAEPKRVVGVDFSPEMIARGESRFPDVEFVEADVCELPFEDGEFNFVVCIETLSFILDDALFEKAVSELCRVCNGELFILDVTALSARIQYDHSNAVIRPRDQFVGLVTSNGLALASLEEHYFGKLSHIDSRKTVMYFVRPPESLLEDEE